MMFIALMFVKTYEKIVETSAVIDVFPSAIIFSCIVNIYTILDLPDQTPAYWTRFGIVRIKTWVAVKRPMHIPTTALLKFTICSGLIPYFA
jgi:hypothetical protein